MTIKYRYFGAHPAGFALLLAPLVGLLLSCGGATFEPVEFQPLLTEFPGTFAAGTYVFKNLAEMAAAWALAPQEYGVDPTPNPTPTPMPTIDFGKYSVVGISLGVGIRCFIPQITQVLSSGDDLKLVYQSAADTGATTLACLHMWPLTAFAKVPAVRGSVSFERVSPSINE